MQRPASPPPPPRFSDAAFAAPAPASVDPTRCPVCDAGNGCAAEAERATGEPQPPCWCMATPIPPEVLAQVPDAARGLACLCRRCATAGEMSR